MTKIIMLLLVVAVIGGVMVVLRKPYGSGKVQADVDLAPESPAAEAPQSVAVMPESSSSAVAKMFESVDTLQVSDIVVGTGAEAVSGSSVSVNYRGTLPDGTEFDSSFKRNQPFTFALGTGQVIQGWDEGVAGMKVGGKRTLTIPPQMAYGDRGVPGVIPAGSTLRFEVELLDVK